MVSPLKMALRYGQFFLNWSCVQVLCFFFQAQDGIRDIGVTGVQTCALPIYSLSEVDQLKLEVAKSLREDFLQQNAFHEIDTYCSLQKQFRMLKLILTFYEEAREALANNIYLTEILDLPVREKIARAKNISEDALNTFDGVMEELKEAMKKLVAEGGNSNAERI